MAVPLEAVELIKHWCEARDPPEFRDRARLEATVSGNKITIVECTRMPDETDWLRVPSAQFRYDPRTRVWTLHWADRRWRGARGCTHVRAARRGRTRTVG